MTIKEQLLEVRRVKIAINKSNSEKLITDYSKYLRKLIKELKYTCFCNKWDYKKLMIMNID